jgi:hypothetical protein
VCRDVVLCILVCVICLKYVGVVCLLLGPCAPQEQPALQLFVILNHATT